MDVFKDDRFKHVVKDPRFRNVPRKDRKVKIDKRFESMFTDDKFKLKYSVDQRGRPLKHSQIEDLKKYYELSDESDGGSSNDDKPSSKTAKSKGKKKSAVKAASDSEDESSNEDARVTTEDSKLLDTNEEERSILTCKVLERLKDISVDYARGEGVLDTDSSSSDEATSEDSEEEIEHDWGELDRDAEETDEATKRLAVCNLDWDRVRATDIMVLLHSFLPPTGFIQCVTIYPSEFGLERMKEEEIKGPQELTAKRIEAEEDEKDSDEDDEFHREKLREYQMKRLRYFYAVVEFDCVDSANKVYTECDRMEYESSATRLDLRFIPDDMTFDQEPRESCTSLPVAGNYKPRLFANTALQQEKVELTWDETDPNRLDVSRRLAQGAAVSEADLKAFIATSSEEEDAHSSQDEDANNGEGDEKPKRKDRVEEDKGDDIGKYRSLLAGIRKDEERKNKGKVEMEISWDLALENRAKAVDDKNKIESLTPFQKMLKNKQEKKKVKKDSDSDNLLSDDDLPSDIDVNDPFFKEELGGKNKKKKKKDGSWNVEDKSDDEAEKKRTAELELLLADGEEEAGKKHFSLKAIQEREAKQNKKGKKSKNSENNLPRDDFKIDLKDDRFGALFTSHLYNVDPADSHFRRTIAMDDIIAEKSKRRRQGSDVNECTSNKKVKSDGPQLSSEVNKLLTSVKKKATKLNNK